MFPNMSLIPFMPMYHRLAWRHIKDPRFIKGPRGFVIMKGIVVREVISAIDHQMIGWKGKHYYGGINYQRNLTMGSYSTDLK